MRNSTKASIALLIGLGVTGACASKDQTAGRTNDLVPIPDSAGSSSAGGKASSAGGASESRAGSSGQAAAGAGAAGDATAGAGGTAAVACPEGRGPEMVAIELSGLPRYCIDTTEVTQGQYATFLAAKDLIEPKAQTRGYCRDYNKSFVPPVKGDQKPGCPAGTYDPETKAELPMSCVDFCDAIAFCEWSGKRLCGSVGGGSLPKGTPSDSKQSQWFLACSQGGKTKYPYGDTFEPGKCDSKDRPSGETRPAAESACAGQASPFDRIKDLSGSLHEYEDRVPDAPSEVPVRGGYGWEARLASFECADDSTTGAWGNEAASPVTGFRCCADLQ